MSGKHAATARQGTRAAPNACMRKPVCEPSTRKAATRAVAAAGLRAAPGYNRRQRPRGSGGRARGIAGRRALREGSGSPAKAMVCSMREPWSQDHACASTRIGRARMDRGRIDPGSNPDGARVEPRSKPDPAPSPDHRHWMCPFVPGGSSRGSPQDLDSGGVRGGSSGRSLQRYHGCPLNRGRKGAPDREWTIFRQGVCCHHSWVRFAPGYPERRAERRHLLRG